MSSPIQPWTFLVGAFYKPNPNQYEVIAAPIGAVVSSLPDGTNTVVKTGETYFEYGQTYYKAASSGGGVVYEVVTTPV